MDSIDREILKHLQQNARISIKSLADLVSLTSPAVAERIKKLEESKVILGYTAIIDSKKLEKSLKAIINITIIPEKQNAFIEFAQKIENILCVHHVTGAFSMSATVVFKDMPELELLIKEIQRFGKTQTLVIMSTPISSDGVESLI
jgi:Lrp/AsnC family transcriptional regulator, leucine-responsive regulatory protein